MDGVENSEDGTKLFKDDREQYPVLHYNVNGTSISGYQTTELYGNITVIFNAIGAGLQNNVLYNVTVTHGNDSYYTFITNSTLFTLPLPDANKTVSPNPALKGERMEYILTITNVAPLDASFVVTDYLPEGFVYQGANVTPTSIVGNVITWSINLGNNTSGNNVMKILVWGYANVSGTNLTNRMSVWNGTNNVTVNVTSEIIPMANLTVTKIANVKNATVGDIIEQGEKDYYSAVHSLTCIPSDMISTLWDMGIDWEELDDFAAVRNCSHNLGGGYAAAEIGNARLLADSGYLFRETGRNEEFRAVGEC